MHRYPRSWLTVCARDGAERPTRLDAVLVIGLLLVGLLELLTAQHALATWLLLPALVVPLYWHRRFAVIALIGTLGVLAPVLGVDLTFSAVFAILVGVWSAAAFGTREEARWTGVATAVAISIVVVALLAHGAGVTDAIANIVLFGTAWVAGDNLRQRRERTAALEARATLLERERERELARAAADERARIARELHDVIAHTVSVMVVQAGAARRVVVRDPDRATQALADIERTGRDALDELRRLLGVLRPADGGEAPADRAPQPDLASLPELIEQLRTAGLEVELFTEGQPTATAPGVELTAFRVVQEALTNTVKHAGPARAIVAIRHGAETLEIEIEDDGRGAAGALASSGGGNGLRGMRERVQLFGGELEAGPRTGGGYRVRARLPAGRDGTGAEVVP